MIRTVHYCDVCGAERREVNGWWVVAFCPYGFVLRRWSDGRGVFVQPGPAEFEVCGESCLHKKVSELMAQSLHTKPVDPADDGAEVDVIRRERLFAAEEA